MGKKLIIKGADFSKNAVSSTLPIKWDYEIIGFFGIISEYSGSLPQDYYWVNYANGQLRHVVNGVSSETIMENGCVLKIAENLYAVYNDGDFTFKTDNDIIESYQLSMNSVYGYNAPCTFQNVPSGSFSGAKFDVEKGDILIFKGSGGSSVRLISVTDGVSCERIAASNSVSLKNSAYVVNNPGTVYFNSANSMSDAYIKRLR